MPGSSGESIAVVVRQVLSGHGAMAEDELLDALEAHGIDLGHDPDATLADVLDEDAELVMPLIDGRWAWIPALLDGRTFTHRLNELEVEHGIISWDLDLAPVSMLTESETYQRLVDGSPITDVSPFLDGDVLAARGVPATAVDAEGVLLLPPGYFAARGVVAGDLVGLRVTPKGFEFATVAEPSPCNIGTALTALLDDRRDSPEMLDAGVWTACADDGSLFREPTEPLGICLRPASWFAMATGSLFKASTSVRGRTGCPGRWR